MKKPLHGSHVAIVTPMAESTEIDFGALASLLEWHIAEGSDGIVIAGTTGESPTLSVREHQEIIARTVAIVNGRLPVIAGVGANSTQEAVALTQQARTDGADAGLSVTPYYNKPPQEGLYRHFSTIADKVDLPIILYDVPGRCITAIADDTVTRLAMHDNIVGIKDASGDVSRIPRLKETLARINIHDFLQLSGDDKTSLAYLLCGGDGVISVTANIAPRKMRNMVAAARAGDTRKAQQLNEDLQAFHHTQGVESNPIPVKAALAMANKIGGAIRLPLTPLSADYHDLVRQSLSNAQRKTK